MSDNEAYLFIKYIKSVLWRVAKRQSYIEDARCLKVNFVLGVLNEIYWMAIVLVRISFTIIPTVHSVKKDHIDFH